jgi:hypothetical protein
MTRASRFFIAAITVALAIPLVGCAPQGEVGPAGPQGETGEQGPAGERGPAGATGPQGLPGSSTGTRGATGPAGPAGPAGAPGPTGPAGATGATGSGDSALFFALMPSDNPATVAVGANVEFPQNGPTTSTETVRLSPSSFQLGTPGVYRVSFQVPVTEAGQLVVALDGSELAYTVVGRATGTAQISLTTLVETTTVDQAITIRNPAGNSTALTITPLAGGTQSVGATLLIELVKAS